MQLVGAIPAHDFGHQAGFMLSVVLHHLVKMARRYAGADDACVLEEGYAGAALATNFCIFQSAFSTNIKSESE